VDIDGVLDSDVDRRNRARAPVFDGGQVTVESLVEDPVDGGAVVRAAFGFATNARALGPLNGLAGHSQMLPANTLGLA
jgi:hypothetical protein